MVGEIGVAAGDGLAGDDILGLKVSTIGGEDELRLGAGGGGAVAQRSEGCRDVARRTGFQVDVAGLQDAANVGLVGRSIAQALYGGVLVAEGQKKGIGELGRVKRLLGKF